MNCWKSICIETEFGKERLWIMSALIALGYFMVHFVVISTFTSNISFVDYGIIFFILLLIVVIPLHLVLHCLPIWISGRRATFGIRKNQWPYVYFSTKDTVPKRVLLIAISLPAISITTISIVLSVLFPHLMHYMAIISAVNMGICFYDYLHFMHIKSAPSKSLIEEYENGYHILCKSVHSPKTQP
ncbi:DUF3267 domain-containing protein [Evansella sp. AB-rgal1]|uniref:DUF3267 domain-containing protein n=1 Tax=Evansella sp. AB-rgal1 TaxID=3242696 RepID=UPI00359DD521